MNKNKIENAKKLLRSGELVIFPTETVYGLGGNANDKNAIKRIYNIKKRPANNPIICHFESLEQIKKDFHLSRLEEKLAKKLWPGPITLILRKKTNTLDEVKKIHKLVIRYRGLEKAEKLTHEYHKKAIQISQNFPDSRYKKTVILMLDYLINRSK